MLSPCSVYAHCVYLCSPVLARGVEREGHVCEQGEWRLGMLARFRHWMELLSYLAFM